MEVSVLSSIFDTSQPGALASHCNGLQGMRCPNIVQKGLRKCSRQRLLPATPAAPVLQFDSKQAKCRLK
eukprot:scaffold18897_cov14-Tisochrysis_lutea.AAC.1